MAASPWRSIAIALITLLTVWMWALAGVLYTVRWNAIVRPLPPIRQIFPYGEMRVGVDASYPPFAVATATDIFGLDIDLARALGAELDIPVRFVNLGYDGLYDALRTDQVDVLISALLVDPTRGGAVLYSQSYFNAGLVLVSNHDSAIEEMTDLPGRSLALEFGSEAQTEAERWLRRVLPFDVLPYELPAHVLDAVRIGEADAALVESIAAHLYLRDHDSWQVQIGLVTNAPFAIATRADRGDKLEAISRALQALIDEGTLQQIIERYL